MLLYILIGLAVIIAAIFIVASTKPDSVHYERSITISAPAEKIVPHLIDFRKWVPWSPWEKKDPEMKRSYNGPTSGVGAKYGWSGNSKTGEGTMEVLNASLQNVKIDLRFVKPFKSDCISNFHLTPAGNATAVRWTMDGPNQFIGKVMCLFVNMDKMVGKDFEEGLAGLKTEAEKH